MRGPDVASITAWSAALRPHGPADLGRIPGAGEDFHAGAAVPLLAGLDALATERRDWHPAIAAVLAAIGREPSPWSQASVADFFRSAATGPRFLAVAEALVAAAPAFGGEAHPQRITPAQPLADRLPDLRVLAEAYAQRPPRLLLKTPTWRFVTLGSLPDLLETARHSIAHGNPRDAGPEPWRRLTLGWLAELAVFSDALAALLPQVVAELLACDRPAEGGAALQLAAMACTKASLAADLDRLAARSPGWLDSADGPDGLPSRTWLDRARAAVAEEIASPPPGGQESAFPHDDAATAHRA